MGLHRVGHDWSDLAAAAAVYVCQYYPPNLSHLPLLPLYSALFLRVFIPALQIGSSVPFLWISYICISIWYFGEGNDTLLQYSCLENPMDGGAWKAEVHGVDEGRTRLSDFTFTFHFHALEKERATHSSVLAWRIPGTGEPGGLLSMGSHRVGHDWSDLAYGIYFSLSDLLYSV